MAAAVEVMCSLAALSWLLVLSVAVGLGLRFWVGYRARRRRMRRLLDVVRLPTALSRLRAVQQLLGTSRRIDTDCKRVVVDVRTLRQLTDALGAIASGRGRAALYRPSRPPH